TTEYVRSQPDFFAVGPASSPEAIDMGQGIWCSPGMSSSYLITTEDGRVVVNTGMWFEARTHKRNYDAVTTAPTRYIVLTQSHTDHIGGVDRFREPETKLIAQANIAVCQADDVRIHGLRIRRSLPFFADVIGQPGFARGDAAEIPPVGKPAEPEMLLLGHHGPVRGAATVRAECERIRDAVQYVYDANVDAMNRGLDVWTAMHEIALPEHLEVGEAYGRIDWSVRAIWETYAGWF